MQHADGIAKFAKVLKIAPHKVGKRVVEIVLATDSTIESKVQDHLLIALCG